MKRLLPLLMVPVLKINAPVAIDSDFKMISLPGVSNAYAEEAAAVKYTCPMHPQIISDRPGSCPICGMDLVLLEEHKHHEDNILSFSPGQIEKLNIQAVKVERSTVPKDAVLQTFEGDFVVLSLGDGRFSLQPVMTGKDDGSKIEITSGLQDGQEVVVKGQFLIQAESELNKARDGNAE